MEFTTTNEEFYSTEKEIMLSIFSDFVWAKNSTMDKAVEMYEKIPAFLATYPFWDLHTELIVEGKPEFKEELYNF